MLKSSPVLLLILPTFIFARNKTSNAIVERTYSVSSIDSTQNDEKSDGRASSVSSSPTDSPNYRASNHFPYYIPTKYFFGDKNSKDNNSSDNEGSINLTRLDDVTILGLVIGIVLSGFLVMAVFGYLLYKRMKCKLDREEFRRHTSAINRVLSLGYDNHDVQSSRLSTSRLTTTRSQTQSVGTYDDTQTIQSIRHKSVSKNLDFEPYHRVGTLKELQKTF